MKWLIYSKSEAAILLRTIIEAILSYLCANLGDVLDLFRLSSGWKTFLMGVLMVVFTKILSFIRSKNDSLPQPELVGDVVAA